jgi:hypothetical protein
MVSTATIRLPERARDQFAALARQYGVSVSAYLVELARRERRDAILAAARQEALDFEDNPHARAEFDLWDGTLATGIA